MFAFIGRAHPGRKGFARDEGRATRSERPAQAANSDSDPEWHVGSGKSESVGPSLRRPETAGMPRPLGQAHGHGAHGAEHDPG